MKHQHRRIFTDTIKFADFIQWCENLLYRYMFICTRPRLQPAQYPVALYGAV